MTEPVLNAKVGDTVWVARAGGVEQFRPCRVCNGDKAVTLIRGNGEHVRIGCQFCSVGLENPTGRESYHAYAPKPTPYRVTGVERVEKSDGVTVQYRSGSDSGWTTVDAKDCFASPDDAMGRCAALVAEHEAEQELAFQRKDQNHKSYAWYVGYHLREAERARKQADYHERKAAAMKALEPSR
ncbi:MAG: hypothetical protein A3E78_03990 [Alphaproteobacteria bacterium RIFCSPHIGHO2_12_FULL_63_12]|nr:MAG: hypothetical protein A3E78_03990 [Alphaproteobacteria bacterium RIFCSPHIGHO2_12_FULL_63_12]